MVTRNIHVSINCVWTEGATVLELHKPEMSQWRPIRIQTTTSHERAILDVNKGSGSVALL